MKARGAVGCCRLVLSLRLLLLDRICPRNKHTRLHTLCGGYSSNHKIRIRLSDLWCCRSSDTLSDMRTSGVLTALQWIIAPLDTAGHVITPGIVEDAVTAVGNFARYHSDRMQQGDIAGMTLRYHTSLSLTLPLSWTVFAPLLPVSRIYFYCLHRDGDPWL